jgi:hypothetical protein
MCSSRNVPKVVRCILSVGLLAVLSYEGWWVFQSYVRPYQRQQWAKNLRHTLLSTKALEAQLRKDNAFGRVTGARVFNCQITQAPPYEKQRWDYVCYLYWGTQQGLMESVHQMKFGVMADSSRITRLSDLVPADGPLPPLSVTQQ